MGIGTNIQKILQNGSSMQRMISQIGTAQDNQQLQNQLHQIQHYTGQLAKDTSSQLKELNSYPPEQALDPRQWKLQRERLQADFTKALDNFQRAQRSAAQKEKEAIKKYKNQGVPPGEGGGGAEPRVLAREREERGPTGSGHRRRQPDLQRLGCHGSRPGRDGGLDRSQRGECLDPG